MIPVVGANLSGGRRLGPRDSLRPGRRVDVAALDGAVEAEQTRLTLYNPVDVPANLINAGLVAVIVWPLYPAWVVALWLILACIVSLSRALLRHRYMHAASDTKTSPTWARVFMLNAFVAGCLWGISASVILMTPDPVYYNFIVFVLGGTMAGGVVCLAVNLQAMLAFILPTILPAIVALAVRGGLVEIEMAVMLALFTCALVWTGRSFNRSFTENIRLRFGLQASEAAMAESQALAHVGTWVLNLQDQSAVWSAETYRIFGVDPATFKPSAKSAVDRIHPDDAEAARKDYETLLATGSSQGIEHRIVMNDGAIKDVHELGRVVYGAEGRPPVQVVGTVQDVTARTDAGIAHAQGAADTANQNAMSASNSASHAQATAQDAVNRANTLEGAVIGLDSYQTLADVSVLFGFGKDQLTSQGKKQLDQVGTQVATSRGYLLEITGATDSVGGADYNYQLSERRAQAVVQYLATKYNIAPHKFYLIGLGKDQAKATRASARAKDRKVEVRLLSNKPGQSTAPATVASGAY